MSWGCQGKFGCFENILQLLQSRTARDLAQRTQQTGHTLRAPHNKGAH